jgi:hypothetical protein
VLVVVVVLVVAALFLGGVVHLGAPSTTGPAGVPLSSYSAALGPAQSLAATLGGGPWTLAVVVGLDLTSTYHPSSSSGCVLSGSSGYTPIPGYTGNYSTGRLSSWGFVYSNPTATVEMGISVENGQAVDVGTATAGGSCKISSLTLGSAASKVVDSTQVASNALENPTVDSYISTHATANVSLGLVNEGGSDGTVWGLSYTQCNPANLTSPPTGTRVDELFNATTGTILTTVSVPIGTDCDLSSSSTVATGVLGTNGSALSRDLSGATGSDAMWAPPTTVAPRESATANRPGQGGRPATIGTDVHRAPPVAHS